MKKIYCISGLGADEKAFAKLHVEGYELVHLSWLKPLQDETIEAYAARMSKAIKEPHPVLIGLSFGGMMVIEIAKQIPVEKVILISSVKSSSEIPAWMKMAGKLKLNRVLPMKSYDALAPIQDYFIGAKSKTEKAIVREYRKKVSQDYLDWAVNQVLNWKNNWNPPHLYHIHGNADRIFPIKKIHTSYIVNNAGHFMIMNKAKEINHYLSDILTA